MNNRLDCELFWILEVHSFQQSLVHALSFLKPPAADSCTRRSSSFKRVNNRHADHFICLVFFPIYIKISLNHCNNSVVFELGLRWTPAGAF